MFLIQDLKIYSCFLLQKLRWIMACLLAQTKEPRLEDVHQTSLINRSIEAKAVSPRWHDSNAAQRPCRTSLVLCFPTGIWTTMETAVSGEDKLFLKSAFVSFSHRGQTMTSAQQTCPDSPESAGRPKRSNYCAKNSWWSNCATFSSGACKGLHHYSCCFCLGSFKCTNFYVIRRTVFTKGRLRLI